MDTLKHYVIKANIGKECITTIFKLQMKHAFMDQKP